MFSVDDTIVAIATPVGRGGIGVVRISGPHSPGIAAALTQDPAALEPRRATFARLKAAGGTADQVILTFFPGPHSYTGEDVVEISGHGQVARQAPQPGASIEPGMAATLALVTRAGRRAGE